MDDDDKKDGPPAEHLCEECDETFQEFLTDVSMLVETVTDSLADAMFVARNATRSDELIDVLKGLREACSIAGGMADECGPMLDEMVMQLEPESDVMPVTSTGSRQPNDPDPTLN